MSDLKVRSGQPIAAEKWNRVVDRLPPALAAAEARGLIRLVLCRTTEDIAAAVIDASDTSLSVYSSGVVNTYGLLNNGDGTFSPGLTNRAAIMINAAQEVITTGTELWALESWDGVLTSTVWVC